MYHSWGSYENISTARQFETMKVPQIETYLLIQQSIIDNRKEAKITRIIFIFTLIFAAASFIVALLYYLYLNFE